MSRLVWTVPASQDLEEILEYIAADSRPAALRTVRRIRAAADSFRGYAKAGRPGDVPDTREIVVPGLPYVIVYREMGADLQILRIRHAAQLWPQ